MAMNATKQENGVRTGRNKKRKIDCANLSALNNRFRDGKYNSFSPAAGMDERANGLIVNC